MGLVLGSIVRLGVYFTLLPPFIGYLSLYYIAQVWGKGEMGKVKLSFLLFQNIFSYFCASLKCDDFSPGFLISHESIFKNE